MQFSRLSFDLLFANACVSISPTFFERNWAIFFAPIKSLTFTSSTKKLCKKLLYKKATRKMSVKLTLVSQFSLKNKYVDIPRQFSHEIKVKSTNLLWTRDNPIKTFFNWCSSFGYLYFFPIFQIEPKLVAGIYPCMDFILFLSIILDKRRFEPTNF